MSVWRRWGDLQNEKKVCDKSIAIKTAENDIKTLTCFIDGTKAQKPFGYVMKIETFLPKTNNLWRNENHGIPRSKDWRITDIEKEKQITKIFDI